MSELSLTALERDVDAARSRLADSLTVLASPDSYSEAVEAAKRDARGLTRRSKAGSRARPRAISTSSRPVPQPIRLRFWRWLPASRGDYSKSPRSRRRLSGPGSTAFSARRRRIWRRRQDRLCRPCQRKAARADDRCARHGPGEGRRSATVREKTVEARRRSGLGRKTCAECRRDAWASISAEAGERAASASSEATRWRREGAARGVDTARETLVHSARTISDNRDQALLGIAGVAVAAAIGVALNRRMEEEAARVLE